MKITGISYPTSINGISNPFNGNTDVFVELEDGTTYTLVAITPQNIETYMSNEGISFVPAGPPFVIVKSIADENIRVAIESYAEEDAYWLKVYHLAGTREQAFDPEVLDKMIQEQKRSNEQLLHESDYQE